MNIDDLPKQQLLTTQLETNKKLRRGRDGILEALDPMNGGLWDLRVTTAFLDRCCRLSDGERKTLAYTVPHACTHPTRIYQGVRDEGEHEWLCYCAQPTQRYRKMGGMVESEDDEVFLVYVNQDRRIYSFAWERTDYPNSGLPNNLARFNRRVYP